MTEVAREFEHALRHPQLSLRVRVPVLVTRLGQPLPHGPRILVAGQRVHVVGERGQVLPGRGVECHVARAQLLGLAAQFPHLLGPLLLPLATAVRRALGQQRGQQCPYHSYDRDQEGGRATDVHAASFSVPPRLQRNSGPLTV